MSAPVSARMYRRVGVSVRQFRLPFIGACLGALALGGCSSQKSVASAEGAADIGKSLPTDDKSRCEYRGRSDREVVESRGPGALHPNVRRVFATKQVGGEQRRILLCREVDTNLDGIKDLVRTYDERGEVATEQADSDYDGKVDTWIRFAEGRISKVEVARRGSGAADEFRYYSKGQLSRLQRDENHDGKPDVWEIYAHGRLERMGVDLDFDGKVDRWYRDEVARRLEEMREREEEEKAAQAEEAAKKKAESDKAEGKPVDGYVSPRNR